MSVQTNEWNHVLYNVNSVENKFFADCKDKEIHEIGKSNNNVHCNQVLSTMFLTTDGRKTFLSLSRIDRGDGEKYKRAKERKRSRRSKSKKDKPLGRDDS